MEEYKRSGSVSESTYRVTSAVTLLLTSVNKKDKRRQQIGARLAKLEATFLDDRNSFYHAILRNLQTTLASIQQGTNQDYLDKKEGLEEVRDYELTRLRLWEEYQVKRVDEEYKEDIARAKQNYDMMIKLLKEKFYDKLQRQVKQLKEDKLLLNLVNASLWNSSSTQDANVSALSAAAAASSININDRRSLRKREFQSRFALGETDDLSDSGLGNSSGNGFLRGSGAGSSGYVSASSKRRRHYATRYSSNDEMSSGVASTGTSHGSALVKLTSNGASSGNDSNLSDKDYDALNHLIMNNEEGGVQQIFSGAKTSNRPNTRGSHKQFVGVQGLKVEELNNDLTLLRNAVNVKKEK